MRKTIDTHLILAFLTLAAGIGFWQCWFPGRSFDWERWREHSWRDETRYDMAVRMLARESLIGKTRPEVIAMLGESECVDESDPRQDVLVYHLRPKFMDSEWLSVIFGPDDRVVRCKLWED